MSSDLLSALLADPQSDGSGNAYPDAKQDSNLERLADYVRRLNERDLLQPVNGSSLLELLDPVRNTISYLAVLVAHKNLALKTRQHSTDTLNQSLIFLSSFDAVQARYVGPELRQVIHWLASYYDATRDNSVIPAISAAILQLDPASSTFTTTHLLLVRICLLAGLPRQALPVLDKDIYDFPTNPIKGVDDREPCGPHQSSATFITRASEISGEVTAVDVQEYYLLGAQIYTGLRQWPRAKLFLELVLATPSTHVATPLAVEAYKRLILLGLLSAGQPFSTKGMLDQQAQKHVATLSKAYEVLADAFKNRDIQRFNAEADAGTQVWVDDGNLGLVNQVGESLRRYRVIDLQSTYSALPVDRIAVHLSLPTDTTLSLLDTMIRHGNIKATIQQSATNATTGASTPVLRFLSHHPTHKPVGLDQDTLIQAKYQQIERLSKHVKEADRKLALTKEYTDYIRRSKRAEGAGAPGYEDPMEETWESGPAGDADEDMMGDLR